MRNSACATRIWVAENRLLRNKLQGYDRIAGALAHLSYTISDQTVGNMLKRHRLAVRAYPLKLLGIMNSGGSKTTSYPLKPHKFFDHTPKKA